MYERIIVIKHPRQEEWPEVLLHLENKVITMPYFQFEIEVII